MADAEFLWLSAVFEDARLWTSGELEIGEILRSTAMAPEEMVMAGVISSLDLLKAMMCAGSSL